MEVKHHNLAKHNRARRLAVHRTVQLVQVFHLALHTDSRLPDARRGGVPAIPHLRQTRELELVDVRVEVAARVVRALDVPVGHYADDEGSRRLDVRERVLSRTTSHAAPAYSDRDDGRVVRHASEVRERREVHEAVRADGACESDGSRHDCGHEERVRSPRHFCGRQ